MIEKITSPKRASSFGERDLSKSAPSETQAPSDLLHTPTPLKRVEIIPPPPPHRTVKSPVFWLHQKSRLPLWRDPADVGSTPASRQPLFFAAAGGPSAPHPARRGTVFWGAPSTVVLFGFPKRGPGETWPRPAQVSSRAAAEEDRGRGVGGSFSFAAACSPPYGIRQAKLYQLFLGIISTHKLCQNCASSEQKSFRCAKCYEIVECCTFDGARSTLSSFLPSSSVWVRHTGRDGARLAQTGPLHGAMGPS